MPKLRLDYTDFEFGKRCKYLIRPGDDVALLAHRTVMAAKERPHGLSCSFTLHAPDGTRLVGLDNAHGVSTMGGRFKRKPPAGDHWHRAESDTGQPYKLKHAETLVDDFFDQVERVLDERGIGTTVVKVKEIRTSK